MAEGGRLPHLDALRALAALSVVAFHIAFVLDGFRTDPLGPYLQQLNVGVNVFFVISGLLLYRPFVAARLGGERMPAVGPYAARRALRILPAYWAALLVGAIVLGLPAVLTLDPGWRYWGLLQVYDEGTLFGGLGHAWTLCIELSFYALLPLWAFALTRVWPASRRARVVTELVPLAVAFVASVAWKVAVIELNVAGDAVRIEPALVTLPAYLDHFAAGMALAVASVVLSERGEDPAAVRWLDRWSWVPWVVAVGVFVLLGALSTRLEPIAAELVVGELKLVVALAVVLPALLAASSRGAVPAFLRTRVMVRLGLVSYGIYLWHLVAAREAVQLGLGDVPAAVLGVLITLVLAAASYYGLERHAQALGRRVGRRRRAEVAA